MDEYNADRNKKKGSGTEEMRERWVCTFFLAEYGRKKEQKR